MPYRIIVQISLLSPSITASLKHCHPCNLSPLWAQPTSAGFHYDTRNLNQKEFNSMHASNLHWLLGGCDDFVGTSPQM